MGAQGWPFLSQSLQQPCQRLPSATLRLVQLSFCLLLLSVSWDSTTNTIYAVAAGSRQALIGALSLSLLTPPKTHLAVAGQDGCMWDKHRVQKGLGLPCAWLVPAFLLAVPP